MSASLISWIVALIFVAFARRAISRAFATGSNEHDQGANIEPEWIIICWNRCGGTNGLISNDDAMAPPLDWPTTVILFGLPPKYLMYFFTHFNANKTSSMPALPGMSVVFVDKNPETKPKRYEFITRDFYLGRGYSFFFVLPNASSR